MADDPRPNEELESSTRKWMVAGLVLMALFVLAFPLYRIYEPSRRAEAREDQLSFLAVEGEMLFQESCSECHGPAGAGAIAPAIGSAEFLQSVPDSQISQLTAVGVPGTEMVAYSNDYGGPMTQSEINSITTYLRSLEEDAPSIPTWRTPLVEADYTSAQIFGLACARCHGVNAGGIEDVAPDISQDSLTMMESDEWIVGRIAEGYKDMPRFNNVLSETQIADLVVFLRFGSEGPPPTTTTTTPPDDGSSTTTTQPDTTVTTVGEDSVDPEVLALGQSLYTETFGFDGCQECHGLDLRGTSQGPSIIGASRSSILRALRGVPDMEVDTPLTNEEVEAVYQYISWLTAGSPPLDAVTSTTTSVADASSGEPDLDLGAEIFNQRVLFRDSEGAITGCQECHGRDGRGGPDGPTIIGASRASIVSSLDGGVIDMSIFEPKLTEAEIAAVYAYIQELGG